MDKQLSQRPSRTFDDLDGSLVMKNQFHTHLIAASRCVAWFAALGLVGSSLSVLGQCEGEADHVVYASNFSYEPSELIISEGESVAFVNIGGYHDVNGDINTLTGSSYNNPESFYLPPLVGNSSGVCIGVFTFDIEGEYAYDCSIGSHAQLGMVASIEVQASAAGGCTYDFACNFNPDASFDDGSCEIESCATQGDLDGDGSVTTQDLLLFLTVFGS